MVKFKRMNLVDWTARLSKVTRRFPVTFVYIVIATVYFCILVSRYLEYDCKAFDFFMSLWSLSGIVLSYMIHLFVEGKGKGKQLAVIASANIVWAGICAFFACNYPLSGTLTAACIACCVAIVLGLFTIPFYGQKDDRPAISFTLNILGHIGLAIVISGILFLGLELLLQSFVYLFGFYIGNTQISYLLVFCFVFLAPSLVVLQTPSAEEMYAVRDWMQHKFMNEVIHFQIIPLHLVYLVTLYFYVIKIIITWTLPDGWVSWLVAALMFLTIIIVGLLYPVNFRAEKKPFDKFVLRYLPLVVLPLLLLMTIGIIRRFSDYGVSVLRIYLLAFNLWCYAVCIGLYIMKAKRLSWVASSFAVSLLILSVLPYNVYTFTRDQLRRDVIGIAGKHGVTQFPMDKLQVEKLLKKLDGYQAGLIVDKLSYLSDNYDSLGTDGIVEEWNVWSYDYVDEESVSADTAVDDESFIDIQYNVSGSTLTIPEGYTSFRVVKYEYNTRYITCATRNDTLSVTLPYTIGGKKMEDVISMPVAELKKIYKAKKPHSVVFYGKNTCFYLTSLCCCLIEEDKEGVLEGVLFIK